MILISHPNPIKVLIFSFFFPGCKTWFLIEFRLCHHHVIVRRHSSKFVSDSEQRISSFRLEEESKECFSSVGRHYMFIIVHFHALENVDFIECTKLVFKCTNDSQL